jgi:type IV pilus assembly protein PilO
LRDKLTRREKILLSLFFITCTFIAFYKIGYGWIEKYLLTKAEVQQKRAVLTLLQGIYSNKDSIDEVIKTSLVELPSDDEISTYIVKVESWARNENISLLSIKPGEIVENGKSKVKVIPVEITLEGKRDSFIRFLNYMESFERISQVSRVTMEYTGKADLWKSTLTVNLFYYPMPDVTY